MEWLNYHHLLYFWMVAKEGTRRRRFFRMVLAQHLRERIHDISDGG